MDFNRLKWLHRPHMEHIVINYLHIIYKNDILVKKLWKCDGNVYVKDKSGSLWAVFVYFILTQNFLSTMLTF